MSNYRLLVHALLIDFGGVVLVLVLVVVVVVTGGKQSQLLDNTYPGGILLSLELDIIRGV